MEIDHKLVVKGAMELVRLPDSVKVVSQYGDTVTINRQKAPGQIWKDRQITLDFEKWPVVILQRQGGEYDPPRVEAERLLFRKIEVNVAAPTGSFQLGKTIELLLGI